MSFKPNGVIADEHLFVPQEPEYEMCYTDFDTPLVAAASSLQNNYIIVEHKRTGWKRRFEGVSKFYGLGKKRDGGWINDENTKRFGTEKPPISAEDFIIHTESELIECPEPNMTLLEYGMRNIDFKVGDIKRTMKAHDYRLYIGGVGGKNFRYDVAQIIPYKGARSEKPLLFLDLREAFIEKYKHKVLIGNKDIEVDDEVSIKGWESYHHFIKTGKHKYVLSYVDKDIRQVPCPYFNYNKTEDGIIHPTIEDCARHFTMQLLCGDKSTDNIQGLPNISKEFATKYKIRKSAGLGGTTAIAILEDCKTPVEMYARVVEAYKSFYGEAEFDFVSHEGVESKRTWADMLRENATLLYMCRSYEEVKTYDIIKQLEKMGVING